MQVVALMTLAALAFGQDKATPAEILKKAFEATDKREGAHVKEIVESAWHKSTLEGIVKKDFSFLDGKSIVEKDPPVVKIQYGKSQGVQEWAKGDDYLFKIEDPKFKGIVPTDTIGQADGIMAAFVRNPWMIIQESRSAVSMAKKTGTEKIDDVECTVIEGSVGKEKDKCDILKRLGSKAKEAKGYANESSFKTFLDMQNTTLTFKWWVDGEGHIRQMEHKVHIELKAEIKALASAIQGKSGGDAPPFDIFSGSWTLYFYDFDKDLTLDLPKEVKARFKLK